MRYIKTQNAFISGEVGDKIRARTDTDHYAQGVSKMTNFIPSTSGGAFKRTGPFVPKENIMSSLGNTGLSTDITDDVWLIPFKDSESDYLIGLRNKETLWVGTDGYRNCAPGHGWRHMTQQNQSTFGPKHLLRSTLSGQMASPYATPGTVSIVNGSANVVGVGTTFTDMSALIGNSYVINIKGSNPVSSAVKILSITDNLNLVLEVPYVGFTETATAYTLTRAELMLLEADKNPYWSTQSNDTLIFGSKDGRMPLMSVDRSFNSRPYQLGWGDNIGNSEYTLNPRSFMSSPYERQNTNTAITLSFSGVGGGTAGETDTGLLSPATGNKYIMTMAGAGIENMIKPGMFIIIDGGGAKEGVVYVTAINSLLSVQVLILVTLTSVGPNFRWRRSFFYAGNWPTCGAVHQGRLVLSGLPSDPGKIFFSETFNFANFMHFRLAQDQVSNGSKLTETGASIGYFGAMTTNSPFLFEGFSTEGAKVQWLFAQDYLRIGTTKGDFELTFSGDQAGGLSATNIQLERKSGYTSASTQPTYCDDSVLYANLGHNQLRAVDSKNIGVSYKNTDISIMTSNIESEAADFIGQEISRVEAIPDKNIAFALKSRVPRFGDAVVHVIEALCVYKHANVVAWHTLELDSNFVIKDICAVASSGVSTLAISGQINGEKVIAFYVPLHEHKADKLFGAATIIAYERFSTYLDWATLRAATDSNSVTTANLNLTGCDIYLNKKVSIWYDGKLIHDILWTGSYNLPTKANVVFVGFPYQATIKTLIIEAGQRYGNSAGQASRIDTVTVHLYKSASGEIGFEESNMHSLELDATKETTQDKKINFPQSPDVEPRVIIKSKKGLPLNVLGLTLRGTSYDGEA